MKKYCQHLTQSWYYDSGHNFTGSDRVNTTSECVNHFAVGIHISDCVKKNSATNLLNWNICKKISEISAGMTYCHIKHQVSKKIFIKDLLNLLYDFLFDICLKKSQINKIKTFIKKCAFLQKNTWCLIWRFECWQLKIMLYLIIIVCDKCMSSSLFPFV